MVAGPGHGVGRVSARPSRRRCARAVGSARRHRRQTALGRVGIVDRRSIRLNTEVGLIIASRERAAQAERRFESLVDPANSFALALAPTPGGDPHIVWRTVDDGRRRATTTSRSRAPGASSP